MRASDAATRRATPPGASAAAIRHHYDVGLDFYRLWLDPGLSYSCALFEPGEDAAALERAQARKLDYAAREARAPGRARVLDVGCGFGSLLRRMVDVHGVEHAVGLTLAETQAAYVAGLARPGIEARLESWSDHAPDAAYGAIASIGAFEHFARPELSSARKVAGYRAFFERCRAWLEPGGWLYLQTIAYGDNPDGPGASRATVASVFPESDLPRLAEIALAADGHFELVRLRNDRLDYAQTCQAWLSRLRAARARAVAVAGEEVFRRYVDYLKLAIVGFRMGRIGLLRLSLRRIDRRAGARRG